MADHNKRRPSGRRGTSRILEAVTLPIVAPHPDAIDMSTISDSSLSALASPSTTNTYDTPATSLGTSPEPTFQHKRTAVKRKRSKLSDDSRVVADTLDQDAALAVALQQDEYDQDVKRQRLASPSGSESPLSDPDSISTSHALSDQEDYDTGLAKAKAGKRSTEREAAPRSRRKAGEAARKSINEVVRVSGGRRTSDISALSEDSPDDEDYPGSITDDAVSSDDGPIASYRKTTATDGSIKVEVDVDMDALQDSDAWAAPARRRGMRNLVGRRLEDEMTGDWHADRKIRERRKLEKAHPEIKTMWQDLQAVPIITPEQALQPKAITRTLKSFQLEGLNWMTKQEKTHYKGGLLGDEMGMGKTIQAVSLIMSDYPAQQPTLVVVPPVALMQWSKEIAEYTDGKLKVLVYHGQNAQIKAMKIGDIKRFDVIMISYNSLESLYRKQTKGWTRGEDIVKQASPIHAIHFHRLILDEAHSIKSRTTGVAKSCFALKSDYKWCLSGTPVQNRIGEFFSLLRFLEVSPFANYFCKKCSCSHLHWAIDTTTHKCKLCKHASMQHVSVFNQELLNPITQPNTPGEREAAMDRLKLLTSRIMLRRMKRDYVSSMELPPKEVIIHNEFFGEVERDFSSSIMSTTSRTFDTYVSRGVMLNNYANIFGLIMQMRQVSNHPDLILKKHAHEGQNVLVCNICDEPAEEAIRSTCKHDFCRACVKTFMQSVEETGGEADCPRCHVPLAIDLDQPEIEQDQQAIKTSSIINRICMKDWTSSTKIEMLVYDLYKLRSKKQTLKSIIFSQFTSMLQLIEWRLRRAGFNTVMLDGSMTPNQRQRSIDHFMTNPDCEIFLVSLKAGGVALNLTEASRVFIVDPYVELSLA